MFDMTVNWNVLLIAWMDRNSISDSSQVRLETLLCNVLHFGPSAVVVSGGNGHYFSPIKIG